MPVIVETVRSTVLAGNPMGDPAERRVPVYVPPDYETARRGATRSSISSPASAAAASTC
jgi:hypothetical protein